MLPQKICTFCFAWSALLGLRPGLEGVIDEAPAAKVWVQNFSSALVRINRPICFLRSWLIFLQGLVYSAGADASEDVASNPEITAFLAKVRDRLLCHATVDWLDHSPHIIAGIEDQLHLSEAAAPPDPAPPFDGYVWLAKYAVQLAAGTMSWMEFEKHRINIILTDPSLQSGDPISSPEAASTAPQSALPGASPAPSPSSLGASPSLLVLFSHLSPQVPKPSPAEGAALSASGPRPIRWSAVAAMVSPVVCTPAGSLRDSNVPVFSAGVFSMDQH